MATLILIRVVESALRESSGLHTAVARPFLEAHGSCEMRIWKTCLQPAIRLIRLSVFGGGLVHVLPTGRFALDNRLAEQSIEPKLIGRHLVPGNNSVFKLNSTLG